MPVIYWRKVSAPVIGGVVPFLPFEKATNPPPPPPPTPGPCFSEAEVAKFIGLPAIVYTLDDAVYTGIVGVNPGSDTPITLFHDSCCEITLLDYCDVESMISPPPCAIYAPACCPGCLPEMLKLTFSNPTGNCMSCSSPITINLGIENQFGQYSYISNFNPFGNCGSSGMDFTALFECDEDYKDWSLQLIWNGTCVGEGTANIDDCSTMATSFPVYIQCDSVCKGAFQVDVSLP